VPTSATSVTTQPSGALMTGSGTALRMVIEAPWKTESVTRATGNDPPGRGARGYIPLHLAYEARDLHLTPGQPISWRLTLTSDTEK